MSKWRTIKSMPDNELVLVGVWVNHAGVKDQKPEVYMAYYDAETNQLSDQYFESSLPWEKDEFDFWMPIPALPKVNP